MAKAVIQDTVLTNGSDVGVGDSATVQIEKASTGGVVSLWEDRDGTTGKSNPFTADSEGHFEVYATPDRVDIVVAHDGNTKRWSNVALHAYEGPEVGSGDDGKALEVRTDEDGLKLIPGRSQASGLAALDADGLVPYAQLRVLAGAIMGLVPTINATDSDHDVDVSAGLASDNTGLLGIQLSAGVTRAIDVNWSEGGPGGFPSGLSLSADTTYRVFVIGKSDDPTAADVGFDSAADASNLLSDAAGDGYDIYRRVGLVVTDGSSNLIGLSAVEIAGGGVECSLDAGVLTLNETIPDTAEKTFALDIPTGLQLHGIITLQGLSGAGEAHTTKIYEVGTDDGIDPSLAESTVEPPSGGRASWRGPIRTNTSAQVNVRSNLSGGSRTRRVRTLGWIDPRRPE